MGGGEGGGGGCSMNKEVRARGCLRGIRIVGPNYGEGVGRGEGSGRDRGWAETRRILKTFAVLLIFFSKWVKLFYDFHRQFSRHGQLVLSPSPPSLLTLSLILSHRCSAW